MKKIIIIFFFLSKAHASVIYDYEIETFISDIINLIDPYNNNINFSLILDDTPNAFVIDNHSIAFTSGLLKYIQSPTALIGVVAHEIGHIKNFHLAKKKKKVKDLKILNQVSSLAAITTSILSDDPTILLQSTLASQSNFQNYYSSFSKNQEREADLFAIKKLNDLKITSNGLVEFLNFLEKESNKKGLSKESFMFATHPNYDDRLNTISSFSNNKYNKLDDNIYDRFLFIKAKLFGHTENEIKILETYLSGESLDYGAAIILANQGKLLNALKKINKLIDKKPNNTFFLETKADILFNHGYTLEAKKFYEISLSKNNKNIHIKKRLFHINYDNLVFSNNDDVNTTYEEYNDLIFNYSNDINFYHKWLHLFQVLKKEDWTLFINAWIHILNQDKKKAIQKLEKIKKISNNSILVYNTNKLINEINDA